MFLRSSPPKYLQLKIAIQTMLDISTLTIEEVTRRFKVVDDEEALTAGEAVSVGGKLHYTTEHYHCHVCQKEQNKGESFSSSGGRKRGLHRVPKA
jgi:thymidine kinase